MPLPFILAGVAVAAAGYGVKKGVDAKGDLDDAKDYNSSANRLAEKFESDLKNQKTATMAVLERYGRLKKQATESVVDFQGLFDVTNGSSIKNEFKKSQRIVITKEEEVAILKEIGVIDSDLSIKEATSEILAGKVELSQISHGLQSVGAGSLAGVAAGGGAYLGVGSLATASTGTAISGLSGAAATNATLAWLGGGSLASGGFGIAGGTMVLGGLVAGPLLAIGGSVFAAKAAKAKDEAVEHYHYIKTQVDKGRVVISKLSAIEKQTTLCHSTCESVWEVFQRLLKTLYKFANKNMHYRDMQGEDKRIIMHSYAVAYLLRDFITLGIINEQGDEVNPQTIELIKQANNVLS
ncbi:hypothetical protein HYD28_01480 [Pseudoalteromonas shioyasakiensis]|nr:hypothetical protein HYD28_01480 [Pseudoalteromonas shioyasakiensis]